MAGAFLSAVGPDLLKALGLGLAGGIAREGGATLYNTLIGDAPPEEKAAALSRSGLDAQQQADLVRAVYAQKGLVPKVDQAKMSSAGVTQTVSDMAALQNAGMKQMPDANQDQAASIQKAGEAKPMKLHADVNVHSNPGLASLNSTWNGATQQESRYSNELMRSQELPSAQMMNNEQQKLLKSTGNLNALESMKRAAAKGTAEAAHDLVRQQLGQVSAQGVKTVVNDIANQNGEGPLIGDSILGLLNPMNYIKAAVNGIETLVGDSAPGKGKVDIVSQKAEGATIGDDAPPEKPHDPNLVMNADEMSKAQGAGSSKLMEVMALIVRKEQSVISQEYFGTDSDEYELMKVRRNGETINYGLKDLRQVRFYNGKCGITLWPKHLPICHKEGDPVQWYDTVELHTTTPLSIRIDETMGMNAPPLSFSPSSEQLKPMIMGGTPVEFSSALRMNTQRWNLDSLTQLSMQVSNNIATRMGYSFSPPMFKMIAYIQCLINDPGTELSDIIAGMAWVPSHQILADPIMFPYQVNHLPVDFPVADIAWVTLTEFSLIAASQSVGWGGVFPEQAYLPDKWGTECAVVPITSDEMTGKSLALAVRILSKMAYPARFYSRESALVARRISPVVGETWEQVFEYNVDPAQQASTIQSQVVNMVRLDGPVQHVLFVVVDLRDRANKRIEVGAPGSTILLDETWHPGNPHLGLMEMIDNATKDPNLLTALLLEISEWERTCGNNSDRASAMRLVSECSVVYAQQRLFTKERVAVNMFTHGSWSDMSRRSGVPLQLRDWISSNDIDAIQCMFTTPTGRFRTRHGPNSPKDIAMPTSYTISSTNPIIDVLVKRGWLIPAEGNPPSKIVSANRLVAVISEMAEIFTIVTDKIFEVNSWTFNNHYTMHDPGNYWDENSRSFQVLWYQTKIEDTLHALMQVGIQVPAVVPRPCPKRDWMPHLGINYFTYVYNNGVNSTSRETEYCPVKRVPSYNISKYFTWGAQNYTRLILNTSTMQVAHWPDPQDANQEFIAITWSFLDPEVAFRENSEAINMTQLAAPIPEGPIVFGSVRGIARHSVTATPFTHIYPGETHRIYMNRAYNQNELNQTVFSNLPLPRGGRYPMTHVAHGDKPCVYAVIHVDRSAFLTSNGSINTSIFVPQTSTQTSEVNAYYAASGNQDPFRYANFADTAARW